MAKLTTASDIVSNLANFLPTGTFLVFQTFAPLFTNDGNCGLVEKVLTGILVLTMSAMVVILSFTDSITTTNDQHFHGLVTCKGLWNSQFSELGFSEGSSFYRGPGDQFVATFFDFVNAIVSVVVFCTLILLTPPVSTCYYPNLPSTIVKAIPVMVGLMASMYFSFAPKARRGVGYSMAGLVSQTTDDTGSHVPDGTGKPTAPSTTTGETATAALDLEPDVEGASARLAPLSTQLHAYNSTNPSPEHGTSVV